jgi:Tol biopolymer transport system component
MLAVVAEAPHESGGVNYSSDVYVVDIDGRHVRNLTHDHASNGAAEWMPDGRRLVFQSRPSDPKRGTPHIFVINSDGTHRRRLTSGIGGAAPAVSPDGRRIAFVVQRRREWDVYVMDADGRPKRRLTRQHGYGGGPSWSPDGRMLLFERQNCVPGRDCTNSLFVINGDGTGLTRLERSGSLGGVAWSPTKRTLAVEHSDAVGVSSRLTIADLQRHGAGLVLRPVKTITNVWPGAFLWAPDGRTIVYENDAGAWVVDARRAQSRRRLGVPAYIYNLTWSPDKRWLAFARSRELGRDPIEVSTAAGRERRPVTRKICCLLDELEWAPR